MPRGTLSDASPDSDEPDLNLRGVHHAHDDILLAGEAPQGSSGAPAGSRGGHSRRAEVPRGSRHDESRPPPSITTTTYAALPQMWRKNDVKVSTKSSTATSRQTCRVASSASLEGLSCKRRKINFSFRR
ncbi:hypothetical protein HYPSUDRAFT_196739 [Hypholoma sublateritium FD-334 SS-4]|uniref:Uncharacterized protein n=1 Tax=Hypholoma sublateritium (strain FD-334 SS-4) TaxID=945553 RepID=A0A0D2PF36_HYPSF|nr:hypothetical protein HYPSUDRAFT_196739 [Hypholoma sublateritium FD-334 SS-4]